MAHEGDAAGRGGDKGKERDASGVDGGAAVKSQERDLSLRLGLRGYTNHNSQPCPTHHPSPLDLNFEIPPPKASGVKRLLRHLTHNGFFDIVRIHDHDDEEKEAYTLTVASKLLVRGSSNCLSPIVKCFLDPAMSSSGLEFIVDVGGGNGTLCKIIGEMFPKLKCIVFDLPKVVENFLETNNNNNNNLKYVGGDMFNDSIPEADAVLLKSSPFLQREYYLL
ncbi:hypothetical protein PIB30_023371 [Stylosanthes scabra]|uniref:O-methyltransferase C-terminal domain-containing protein n=1 Tax=Stylosanthes scabra TaxID=79078 RepID=A0ABU6U906_9FABA|nr:hypothetical protein [Stylosanthes scabra]